MKWKNTLLNSGNVVMHLEALITMSLVFATTFFFFLFFWGGGGGGYFVTRLSRPILSSKFLDPWTNVMYIQKFKLDFLRNYCVYLNQILYESFQVQGNENLMT